VSASDVADAIAPKGAQPGAIASASVVVPAYNEAGIIEDALQQLWDYLHTLDDEFRWELIVVDDGSTDGTGDIADRFAATHLGVKILHHRVNLNLGQALRYAFNNCTGDYVVTYDCDLSYSPDHIGRMLRTIQDTQARIVVASPYMEGGTTTNVPFVRRVASRVANRLLRKAARGPYSTVTGMVRAYDRRFLTSLDLKAMDAEINMEILYKAQLLRARIIEIPAHLDWTYQNQRAETRSSSVRLTRSTSSSLLLMFIFRPLWFFIVPGLVLLALSSWMLVWIVIRVGQNYFDISGGDRFSDALAQAYADYGYSFIVGGVSLIVAVQLLALGIISLQAKRYFEELFHLGTSVLRNLRERDEDW